MIRNLYLLVLNDLAVSYRNKTIFLACFVPLFVVFVLSVVDNPSDKPMKTKLGLIRGETYPIGLAESLPAADGLFSTLWLESESAGKKALVDRDLDGFLKSDPNKAKSATLVVLKRDSVATLTMLEGLDQLQKQVEGREFGKWISGISPLNKAKGIGSETITIWILMLVLLVSFLILPPQIAEEKEKKLLLGLLQAPIRESEWLAAKVITGMALALVPIALLHAATQIGVTHPFGYLGMLFVGSFCFSSMGLLLGLLCKSQGSARALGVVCYLPHLLPSALSDYSKTLNEAAAFIPSYQFFTPIKAMILEDASVGRFLLNALVLMAIGALCFAGSSTILRRRWMMG